MKKTSILYFLQNTMLPDYQNFLNTGKYQWYFSSGFCVYIHRFDVHMAVLHELRKDILHRSRNMYWYEPYKTTQSMDKSIKPRIAHLERTINRLTNELLQENEK